METIVHWVTQYGYAGIFLLLMAGILGIPVPDEIVLLFSGYLVLRERLGYVPTLLAAFFGTMCGITLSYILGRTLGWFLLCRYGHLVHITPERIEVAHRWLERWGRWGLLFGYFVPGFRHLAAYLSGTSKMHLRMFALFAYTGAFLWIITFVTAGRYLGEEWERLSYKVHRVLLAVVLGVVIILAGYYLVRRSMRSGK
jgi:membrane protein DedA with SNARE-associated domain